MLHPIPARDWPAPCMRSLRHPTAGSLSAAPFRGAALSGTYSFVPAKVNQGWQVTNAEGRVPNAAALRPANAITVEGWVKADSSSPDFNGSFTYILNKSSSYGLFIGSGKGLTFNVLTLTSG